MKKETIFHQHLFTNVRLSYSIRFERWLFRCPGAVNAVAPRQQKHKIPVPILCRSVLGSLADIREVI
jgi:hypothetical protein